MRKALDLIHSSTGFLKNPELLDILATFAFDQSSEPSTIDSAIQRCAQSCACDMSNPLIYHLHQYVHAHAVGSVGRIKAMRQPLTRFVDNLFEFLFFYSMPPHRSFILAQRSASPPFERAFSRAPDFPRHGRLVREIPRAEDRRLAVLGRRLRQKTGPRIIPYILLRARARPTAQAARAANPRPAPRHRPVHRI